LTDLSSVLSQSTRVTDGRTDGRTDGQKSPHNSASALHDEMDVLLNWMLMLLWTVFVILYCQF